MLLSAQYVSKHDQSEAGTNSYLYFHGTHSPQLPDLDIVVNEDPGTFVEDHREVHGSGNPVIAFLDVAAPDDVDGGLLAQTLDRLEHRLGAATFRRAEHIHEGHLHARYVEARPGGDSVALFRSLRDSASRLHGAIETIGWRELNPVPVDVHQQEEGYRFVIPVESRGRLATQGFTVPDSVAISDEVWEALDRYHPLDASDLIAILTGRTPRQLLDLGGIVFQSEARPIWQWPGRAERPPIAAG